MRDSEMFLACSSNGEDGANNPVGTLYAYVGW